MHMQCKVIYPKYYKQQADALAYVSFSLFCILKKYTLKQTIYSFIAWMSVNQLFSADARMWM